MSELAVRNATKRRIKLVALGLGSDLLIAVVKFGAAHVTASSAMFAEGMHSVMDASTEIILLYGAYAARRPANVNHQLGFGREGFFWNFVAALVLLALGAGVTFHEALTQIVTRRPLADGWVNYAVLGAAFAIESVFTGYALRSGGFSRFRSGLRNYLSDTRDATSLTVLATNLAGLLGLLIAAAGTLAASALAMPILDGVASAVIAVLMAGTALLLAAQSKSLLIGVPATGATVSDIEQAVAGVSGVALVNGSLSVHLAAEQVLVGLSVSFADGLSTNEIEVAVCKIEHTVKERRPDVKFLFVRPENRQGFQMRRKLAGW